MPDAAPLTADTIRAVLEQVGPSVVRIGRHGGRGNGVVVGDGLVLTNAHNLRDRTTEVRFADGRAAQAEALAADLDGDLVVLGVDTGGAPAITWAEAVPSVGEPVVTVARTSAGTERITVGMVSGVERHVRGPRGRTLAASVEHTAPLARGSSGSPLLDGEGHVVGLNTARLGDGFYLALPADETFRARVDALARGEAPDRPVLGIGVAPASVAQSLRASVGLPPRAGVLVRQVVADGPADRAGVRSGDLITAAGGTEVADVDELHRVLDRHDTATPLALHLVRGSEELDVEITFDGDGDAGASSDATES